MNKITNRYNYYVNKIQYYFATRKTKKYSQKLSFNEAVKKFINRNELYLYMHHYLHFLAKPIFREHRKYFKQEGRGFGEDALHSMWILLFKQYKPKNVLEIGVYRGQTVTLWGLISKTYKFNCEVHGISPFSSAADGVSVYRNDIDYLEDTISSNNKFNLNKIKFHKGFSNSPDAINYIKNKKWDLIYIDGNHDFDVALSDYLVSKENLSKNGILVLDDSSLYTAYSPKKFAFAGHPGPSKVFRDYAMNEMTFLGGIGHNNIFMK